MESFSEGVCSTEAADQIARMQSETERLQREVEAASEKLANDIKAAQSCIASSSAAAARHTAAANYGAVYAAGQGLAVVATWSVPLIAVVNAVGALAHMAAAVGDMTVAGQYAQIESSARNEYDRLCKLGEELQAAQKDLNKRLIATQNRRISVLECIREMTDLTKKLEAQSELLDQTAAELSKCRTECQAHENHILQLEKRIAELEADRDNIAKGIVPQNSHCNFQRLFNL